MTTSFVETTVLTDYLLKCDGSEISARNAFSRYSENVVPEFAWKEFKRGPLANFVWAYNKLNETNDMSKTLEALQRLSRTPQRYLTSTAIQAMHTGFARLFQSHSTIANLQQQYGPTANMNSVITDALKLELKRQILSAWEQRKTLFGGPYHKLSCYSNSDITLTDKRIELHPRDCRKGDCCLKPPLANRKKDIAAMRASLDPNDTRKEITERRRVLRDIEKHAHTQMNQKDCRRFGDAYFVLYCPPDAVILTTNTRDIEPMAATLGIATDRP